MLTKNDRSEVSRRSFYAMQETKEEKEHNGAVTKKWAR